MITKLVTYAYVRAECDISKNVEDEELDSKIRWSQDMLLMLIGKAFFDQIVSEFVASTFSVDNAAFFDPYVKQFLAWQTNEYWTIRANFKDTRAGFRVKLEEHSEPTSDTNLAMLIKEAKSMSSTYKNNLITFLQEAQARDSSKYPLYDQGCSSNFGNGFQISAVHRRNRQSCDINRQIERGS
jgi:hypothetical protein